MATIEKYIPANVPQQARPAIRNFLDTELYRISQLLNAVTELSSFGGLRQVGGQASSLTATPQRLAFTATLPSLGVIPSVANDEIEISADGFYQLNFFVNAALGSSVVMTFEPWINGVPSGSPALFEIIQQAAGASFAASTIVSLNAGDLVSMYVSATPNRTVTFDNVNYYVNQLRGPAE